MNEIVDLFEESDQVEKEKRKKLEEDAADIEEMRRASLESFRETKERKKWRVILHQADKNKWSKCNKLY